MATPSEKIQEFVDYVHTLKGDENGQAQVFTTDCSGRNTAFRLGIKLSSTRMLGAWHSNCNFGAPL